MTSSSKPASATLHVHFEIDGLNFVEAARRAKALPKLEKAYAEKRGLTEDLNRQLRQVEAKYGGDAAAAYDEAETLVVQLGESAFGELEIAARALAGVSAIVQLLSAHCLEAHINIRAADTLPGALYAEFERLALGGKWLLYPRLQKLQGLEAGTAPMAAVQVLAKRRNALAHPKRQRVVQDKGLQTPDFLERMNLTGDAARCAVSAAGTAVAVLAKAEGRPSPDWLNDGNWSLFRHEWQESTARPRRQKR